MNFMSNRIAHGKLRKWVIGAGMFNIIVAFPLAVPVLCERYYALFNALNASLGLGGRALVPPVEGANKLFVNTAGLALALIGILLIYAAGNLRERMGIPFFNAILRLMFPFLLLYYVLAENIARILIVFGIIDIVIAANFFFYMFHLRKQGQEMSIGLSSER